MGDISRREASAPVQLVGATGATDGAETNLAKVDDRQQLSTSDILDNGGADTELTVGTSPVEVKVGASRRTGRKYVVMVPLDSGIKFGFSNTTQYLPIFKSQMVMVPVGENTQVWVVASAAGKKVAIGEIS